MKAFSDLEQSKKLAEILPPESADMKWMYWKEEIDAPKIPTFGYGKIAAETCNNSEAVYLPCWSLAALLNAIPKHIDKFNVLRIDIDNNNFAIWYDEIGSGVNNDLPDITREYAVDACYELILQLHKLKLL